LQKTARGEPFADTFSSYGSEINHISPHISCEVLSHWPRL